MEFMMWSLVRVIIPAPVRRVIGGIFPVPIMEITVT
jgi:hypothetical protein